MFSLAFCWSIQSQVCGRSSEGRNNYFLVCSCGEKNWRGFLLGRLLQSSPNFIWIFMVEAFRWCRGPQDKAGWPSGVHCDGGPQSHPRRDLCGRPLLCDAINLLCADRLICLLSEPGHCRLVGAIVCGGGLKNLDWPDGPGQYALSFHSLSLCVVNRDWEIWRVSAPTLGHF